MRLLHTSDWHLGKLTGGVSRRPDHECVHREIVVIAREFAPDLIVHSGDLFDASMPAVEDMRLGIEMLDELAAIAPVVVLCGNHENPKLFALFQRLRGADRLRFVHKPRRPSDGGILEFPARGGRERIRLAALPFVRSSIYLDEFGDPAQWTSVYGDNIARIESIYAAALADGDLAHDVAIFSAHLHVTGAVLARSERTVHIDDFATRPEAIPPVSYAAFGHIHKPQQIGGRNWARYAGSPIPIDFGELDELKSVVLVEASPGTNAQVRVAELSGGRPLRRARGTLDGLAAQADELAGGLVRVTVEAACAVGTYDRVAQILSRSVLVGFDVLDPARHVEAVEPGASSVEAALPELFGSYLAEHGADDANNRRIVELFTDAAQALKLERPLTFAELVESQTDCGDEGALSAIEVR